MLGFAFKWRLSGTHPSAPQLGDRRILRSHAHTAIASRAPLSASLPLAWVLLAALTILALAPLPAHAKYASLVMDAATGEVLHESNADTRNYPASLTKMMTLYLLFEAIDNGRVRINDSIVMSKHAAGQAPSKLGVAPGKSFPVETAIRALAIKSANDVAAAVAERLGGTESQFALLMTEKARTLGMSNTTFRNASGLPHKGQMSTARDMAILARALLKHFPHHYHYFAEERFSFNGQTHLTHNKLLTHYEGMDGIKTGYIRASGFNLVASVKRGERRLIGVVFGANDPNSRNRQMAQLLDQGWNKLEPRYAAARTAEPAPRTQSKTYALQAPVQADARPAPQHPAQPAAQPTAKARPKSTQDVWGVQVGAFKDYDPAYRIAAKAMTLAAQQLDGGEITVAPLEKKKGNVLYRGRIMGLSKSQAYQACKALTAKKMSCLPLRATDPLEVASID